MTPVSIAALFALASIVVIVGFVAVTTYNAVVGLRQRIDKAWANIDVVLRQHHDQLPALVAAVRGALAFEHDVLTEVARARAAYSPSARSRSKPPIWMRRPRRSAYCSRSSRPIRTCAVRPMPWTSSTRSNDSNR